MDGQISSMRSFKSKIDDMICGLETRAQLFDPDCEHVTFTNTWAPFQNGPAMVKVCEEETTPEQTVVLFKAPAKSHLPMHWHMQDEVVVVVQNLENDTQTNADDFDDEEPVATVWIRENEDLVDDEYKLYVGSVLHIKRRQLHAATFHHHCLLQVIWKPSLPQIDEGVYVWPYSREFDEEGCG